MDTRFKSTMYTNEQTQTKIAKPILKLKCNALSKYFLLVIFLALSWCNIYSQTDSVVINSVSYEKFINKYKITFNIYKDESKVKQYELHMFDFLTGEKKPVYTLIDSIKNIVPSIETTRSFNVDTQKLGSAVKYFVVLARFKIKDGFGRDASNSLLNPYTDRVASNITLKATFDTCKYKIYLNWNRYKGWATGDKVTYIPYIRVYTDNINFIELNPSGLGITDLKSTDTSFVFPDDAQKLLNDPNIKFDMSKKYEFYVAAVKNKIAESSCNSNITSPVPDNKQFPKMPTYIYATEVDSRSNNSIALKFAIDPINELKHFRLERSAKLKNYSIINPDIELSENSNSIEYTDATIEKNKKYYYKLSAYREGCDASKSASLISSDPISNIFISSNYDKDGQTVYLTVRDSDKIEKNTPGSDPAFIVMRTRDNSAPVGKSFEPTGRFSDKLSERDSSDKGEDICYYFMTSGNIPLPDGKQLIVQNISNKFCYVINIVVTFGKYFTPDPNDPRNRNELPDPNDPRNLNKEQKLTWIPKTSVTPKIFNLLIFDRWGTQVFESKKKDVAWDGTFKNGTKAPQGVYLYYLKFAGSDNRILEYKGNVTLLRND